MRIIPNTAVFKFASWAFLVAAIVVASAFALALGESVVVAGERPGVCSITVVEKGTGWPVSMVELRTVHLVRFVTDNAGRVAFDLPELMGRETWFDVTSDGYEVPADKNGKQGMRLTPEPGKNLTIEVTRSSIAKRLGRVTGAGLFAESQKLGLETDWKETGVLGSDSVQNAVHNGRMFWAWGDTNVARYPLGIFDMTSATTAIQPLESFEPPLRLKLNYFTDDAGRPRGVAKMAGEGPTWLSGYMSLPDKNGTERLVAIYMKIKPPMEGYECGLCIWNEKTANFDHLRTVWTKSVAAPKHSPMPQGHPVVFTGDDGKKWALFGDPFPMLRCPATFEAWQDPANWEKLSPQENLHAADGTTVKAASGSIAWNAYRKRWVTVFMQSFGTPSFMGEIWYTEADSPFGPWGTAVKILSHANYSFYNPRLHPEFTPVDSPILLFEGTHSKTFANHPDPTPRYNYNQILYRLDLDDPKLVPAGHWKMILTRLIYTFAVLTCIVAASAAAEEVYVRVNQAGYRPGDVKVAVAMGRAALPAKFQLIDADTQKTAFEGAVRAIDEAWGEFNHHAELDFSAIDKEGEYFVRLGEAISPKFQIRNSAYGDLPDQLLEFMRQQRCGYNPFVDAVCHSFDGRTVDGPLPAGSYIDARGGWHDAGDQLKYLLTASNATAQMLLAYQLGSQAKPQAALGDRVNDLGQPVRNGMPDLLDEARWGLDWMLRLHPASDQLYHQVADDRDHSTGFRLPQNETVDYGWGAGRYRPAYSADGKPQGLKQYKSESSGVANLAGRYAAAMALGYQVWKDDAHLRPYAERCLVAGKEVYAMGKAREGVQQGNSYKSPYRYAETTWADDMEWGAAELLRATGDLRYRTDALHYAELAGTEGWFGKTKTGHYQYYPFMNLGHFRLYDLVDQAARDRLSGYYRDEIELCVKASAGNPYRIGVPFIWCSNNLTVALATECAMYGRMTGDQRYRAFAAAHRDWLMGSNPWGFSMFTEIPKGGQFPRDVHLFTNAVLKKSVRGGLVDGPVARSIFGSLKGVSIREPDPLAAFQDERAVFHDDIRDYSTNEPTMDGTASAILMWVVMAND